MLIKYILRLNKRYKVSDKFQSLSIPQKISIGFFSCVVLFYTCSYLVGLVSNIGTSNGDPDHGIMLQIWLIFIVLLFFILPPIIAISLILVLMEIYYKASTIKNIHPFFKWTICPFSSMLSIFFILTDIYVFITRDESIVKDIYIYGSLFLILGIPVNLGIAGALLMVADERKHKTYYPPYTSYISQKFSVLNFKNYSSIPPAVIWILVLGMLAMVWVLAYPEVWITSTIDIPILGVLGILTFGIRFLNPKTNLWPLIWLYPILFFYFDFIMNFYQGANGEELQSSLLYSTILVPAGCAGMVYAFAWGADRVNKYLLNKNA